MSEDALIEDALLAAQAFAQSPHAFGGIVLRGAGPVRDRLQEQMLAVLEPRMPVVRVPVSADAEQMLGGLDLTQTLATGRAAHRPGLIERARGGVAIVSMAERTDRGIAALLAQAIDRGDCAVILLDDGLDADEAPPATLLERAAFHCDLSQCRTLDFEWAKDWQNAKRARPLLKGQREALALTAAALGIHSVRPIMMAESYARGIAGAQGLGKAGEPELEAAIRLVLAPRATQRPETEPPEPPEPPPPDSAPDTTSDQGEEEQQSQDLPLEDLLLAAAAASIPDHVLDGIDKGLTRVKGGSGGQSGNRETSSRRGRPLGSRPGIPGDGRKLALIDTLRAAAPWQTIRRENAGDSNTGRRSLHIRKSDLRIRHFEQRQESLTIFAVDASGSSAMARLAEAKGAVELMLAQAHVKRSQVALIAFRHSGAEILLPPTRSLTRARRALSGLPGGGGTPLAAGLLEARLMADASGKRGQTPMIALLTDGKANVTLEGEPDRARAMAEAEDAAKGIAAAGHHAVVIDISPRPREEAAALAEALRGKYLALPYAGSAAMVEAIESVAESVSA